MADKNTADRQKTHPVHDYAPEYPGQSLGITGLVFSFVLPLVGLVLGVIAYTWSKKAGVVNGPARAAVIVGGIILAAGLLIYVAWVIAAGPALLQYMHGGWGMRGF
ncbi:MAG: hypothetical protein Q7J04_00625 [Microcella sp.]|nr:hypothetical protein [Microcella sp.]